jgi:hypothetical protein
MRKPRTDNDKPKRSSGGGDVQARQSSEPTVDDGAAPITGEPGSPARPPRLSAAMRRKKARPQIMEDDDGDNDDDLAVQTDGEFVASTWAHMEGRRRSALPASNKRVDLDDTRRRSMNL